MNYADLIKDAFWITLRNRFLWFFGLFAGGGSSFNLNVNGNTQGAPGPRGRGTGDENPAWVLDLFRWVSDNLGLVIAVAVLVLLVLLALSALSQGALVEGVAALDRGEPRRFSSTLRAGASYFLPVLGLNVVFFLIALGLLLVIALPIYLLVVGTFAATESVGVRVLVVVLVVLVGIALLILVFVPLGILYQLALRELVLGGERVFGSIRSGFGLFRRTLGRSLLLGIIQFGLGLVVGVLLLIAQAVAGLGVAVALILAAPFLVVFGAVGTFFSSYWTLAYLRLTTPAEGAVPQPGQGA